MRHTCGSSGEVPGTPGGRGEKTNASPYCGLCRRDKVELDWLVRWPAFSARHKLAASERKESESRKCFHKTGL